MKTIYYSILALSAVIAFSVSCSKEESAPADVTEPVAYKILDDTIPYEIVAEISKEDQTTKTQYAGNVTFGWTSGDQVRMPVMKKSAGSIIGCDFYTFTTSAKSGSASASFVRNNAYEDLDYDPNPSNADNTWTSMGYFVYPISLFNKEYSGEKPVVNLPSSITYSASNPLDGGIVPLIGRKDGDSYKFSTAVGFIKLTISNAPAAAKSVKLVSTDKPLAGKFVISDVDAIVSQIANTSATEGVYGLSLTSLSLTAGETYSFYLPLPVGDYSARSLSLSLLDSNGLPLLEKLITPALSIERNVVLEIPELLYHRVYVKGSLSAPKIWTEKPSSANTIRVHISDTKLTGASYDKNVWVDGNKFGDSQNGSYNLTGLKSVSNTPLLTASGLYYLQYIVSSDGTIPSSLSDASVLAYGSVPFYYSPSANKIPVQESWLDVPYISTAEGAVSNLVDGAVSYWHSPWGSENPARNATYGQIISVDLGAGSRTTDGNFYFSFRTRKGALNDHARHVVVYVSNEKWDGAGFDTNKVKVGETDNAIDGIYPYNGEWIKNPIICSGTGTYRYITVSILTNMAGTDLRTSGCTHMDEIEFYTL